MLMINKKLYIALFIISIIFLSIGGTFAYLTASATVTNITQIKSGNLTMTIDGGGNENVNLFPAECTSDYAIKRVIKASAINTSGGKVSFSIGMNIATLGSDFKRRTMKYALTTSSDSCTDGLVASGNFKDKNVDDDVWLIKNDYDGITQSGNTYTKTYYLYIWLDQSETRNLSGSISVKMIGSSSNNPNLQVSRDYDDGNDDDTLFYQIKSNADKYTKIDFSQTSEASSTNGIYATTSTDNGVPVYYYRGNVDNHVIFANFCWRIIRTTETGGVKLIYDGIPSNGQCNNTGSNTTIGSSEFNSESHSPAYFGYMYGAIYTYKLQSVSSLSGAIVFGNDITYANGTYTLKDTYMLTNASNWNVEYTTISNKYHYTCFTSSDTCTKVNYIYYIGDLDSFYFELEGGKNHLDILKEMLDGSSNENDSTVKTAVDAWYKNNMTSYTSKLEDTVFCNDRSYDVGLNTNGWNKDYNNVDDMSVMLIFNRPWKLFPQLTSNVSPTLACQNTNDKFTVEGSNGNGALTYPVGLITVDEMVYAGGVLNTSNSSYYLYNQVDNWTLSPAIFYYFVANEINLDSDGKGYFGLVSNNNAIRPVISLKQGTILSSGNGTSTTPYIVE